MASAEASEDAKATEADELADALISVDALKASENGCYKTILAVAVASNKKRGGIGLNLALGIILAFVFIFFDKLFSVLVSQSDLNPIAGASVSYTHLTLPTKRIV